MRCRSPRTQGHGSSDFKRCEIKWDELTLTQQWRMHRELQPRMLDKEPKAREGKLKVCEDK